MTPKGDIHWRLLTFSYQLKVRSAETIDCYVESKKTWLTEVTDEFQRRLKIVIPYSAQDENFHKMGEPYMYGVENYYRKFEKKHNIKIDLLHLVDNKVKTKATKLAIKMIILSR